MNRETKFGFGVAAVGAFLVWTLAPVVVAKPLPWDMGLPVYFIAVMAVGVLVSLVNRINGWSTLVGLIVGQLMYIFLMQPPVPVWSKSILLILVSAFLGHAVFRLVSRYVPSITIES